MEELNKPPGAGRCALGDGSSQSTEPVQGHGTPREYAGSDGDSQKSEETGPSALNSPTGQIALPVPALADTSPLKEAEACLEDLRKWRLQQEKNLQEQLTIIEKAEVNPSTPAIDTEELDDLLARGSSVIQQIQATRSVLQKEIEKRPASKDVSSLFSIQSVQSVSVAAKEHGVKIEDLHAQLTGPAGLPQIPNLTEEIAKMELQVACLAEMQQTWEQEQKETEAQLEQLHSEIGQYCSMIEEALEETTRNEAIIGVLRRQDRASEDQKLPEGTGTPVPPDKAASPVSNDKEGLEGRESPTADLDQFIDSVLLQCAEVDKLLSVALQPVLENGGAKTLTEGQKSPLFLSKAL